MDYAAPPIQPEDEDLVSISITEEMKRDLIKIGAEYTLKDGVNRSLEDIIGLLIKEHKESS